MDDVEQNIAEYLDEIHMQEIEFQDLENLELIPEYLEYIKSRAKLHSSFFSRDDQIVALYNEERKNQIENETDKILQYLTTTEKKSFSFTVSASDDRPVKVKKAIEDILRVSFKNKYILITKENDEAIDVTIITDQLKRGDVFDKLAKKGLDVIQERKVIVGEDLGQFSQEILRQVQKILVKLKDDLRKIRVNRDSFSIEKALKGEYYQLIYTAKHTEEEFDRISSKLRDILKKAMIEYTCERTMICKVDQTLLNEGDPIDEFGSFEDPDFYSTLLSLEADQVEYIDEDDTDEKRAVLKDIFKGRPDFFQDIDVLLSNTANVSETSIEGKNLNDHIILSKKEDDDDDRINLTIATREKQGGKRKKTVVQRKAKPKFLPDQQESSSDEEVKASASDDDDNEEYKCYD